MTRATAFVGLVAALAFTIGAAWATVSLPISCAGRAGAALGETIRALAESPA
ncbi:hypothetical protein [Bosea minatitlanensis]|uniref:hypothetical protein n=1 Tax=Bosea minatitlanensis TaxID=128782 RepID=UPI0021A5A417|nr:hypothetical protein [Bosea minatitlanensis]MCT4495449.1 hypothetical protein [Bosea minatitlanensis]